MVRKFDSKNKNLLGTLSRTPMLAKEYFGKISQTSKQSLTEVFQFVGSCYP